MASLSDKIGTRLADRYELRREIGQGGMATAYLAHDRSLDCPVVIKSPHAALLTEPTFTRRFQQEMRSLVKLSHPHIVKITDVGEHEGLPFFVMQYLGGGSLRDRQGNPKTRQPADQLRDWLPKIAEALDFMHDRGYAHRDVKPANILFDEHGHAYLSDFGVAKAVQQEGETESSSSLTGTGMVLGTPDYLAPEVILGEKSDGRADQYALAITVYELLGGRCPFAGPTPTAVMVQHSAAKPRPLKQLAPALSEGLCNAVHRGLAKKPRERYATCREFAATVLAALDVRSTAASTTDDKFFGASVAEALAPPSPILAEILRAACPQCGKSMKLPKDSAGRFVACPACRTRLTVSPDYSLTVAEEAVGANRTAAVAVRPDVASGSGSQRPPQLTGYTPLATNTATNTSLPARAWYRLPWVQAVLAGLVLATWISLIALRRGETQVDAGPVATPERPDYSWLNDVATPISASDVRADGSLILVQTNSINMKLTLIPAGEFQMGAAAGDSDSQDDEKPQHKVKITKPFYLGIHEVTQGQWQAVMNTTPWKGEAFVHEGADYAATYVNWDDATEFCQKLSVKEGKTYRLPTEAEWEYACRAGTTTKYGFGDDDSRLGDYAWWGGLVDNGNAKNEQYPHVVGQKKPNAWGLYDMHGNVWEWCSDYFDEKWYSTSPPNDPNGPSAGSTRVIRGGCWILYASFCRSASRYYTTPSNRHNNYGFRCVRVW